uniref:Uncharacterized protein n=1 Tax=Anopheles minimus TaxID=112268 RepID=A0A182VV96_9DIPT
MEQIWHELEQCFLPKKESDTLVVIEPDIERQIVNSNQLREVSWVSAQNPPMERTGTAHQQMGGIVSPAFRSSPIPFLTNPKTSHPGRDDRAQLEGYGTPRDQSANSSYSNQRL